MIHVPGTGCYPEGYGLWKQRKRIQSNLERHSSWRAESFLCEVPEGIGRPRRNPVRRPSARTADLRQRLQRRLEDVDRAHEDAHERVSSEPRYGPGARVSAAADG